MMNICIKSLSGLTFEVNVVPQNTIAQIRKRVEMKLKIKPVALIFEGKILKDTQYVRQVGLTHNAIVYTLWLSPSNTVKPKAKEEVWLLIKGCTESPSGISVSKRKGYNGDYLYGMKYDFAHMQEFIERTENATLHNMISNMVSLTKQNVFDAISDTCKYAKRINASGINIYYTGHGETNTGNWCLSDGVVSLLEVLSVYRKKFGVKQALTLYVDCCYAGEWALDLRRYKAWNAVIKAACWPGKAAYDDKSNGGIFTSFIARRKGVANKDKRLNWCYSKISKEKGYTIKYVTATGLNV